VSSWKNDFGFHCDPMRERLNKEKRFEQWIYLVPDSMVESILKRRDEILAKPQG
jgi:hypothetical protein